MDTGGNLGKEMSFKNENKVIYSRWRIIWIEMVAEDGCIGVAEV